MGSVACAGLHIRTLDSRFVPISGNSITRSWSFHFQRRQKGKGLVTDLKGLTSITRRPPSLLSQRKVHLIFEKLVSSTKRAWLSFLLSWPSHLRSVLEFPFPFRNARSPRVQPRYNRPLTSSSQSSSIINSLMSAFCRHRNCSGE
jgi:hypothetical protein